MARVCGSAHLDNKVLSVFLFQIEEYIGQIEDRIEHRILMSQRRCLGAIEGCLLEVSNYFSVIIVRKVSVTQFAVWLDADDGREGVLALASAVLELQEGVFKFGAFLAFDADFCLMGAKV